MDNIDKHAQFERDRENEKTDIEDCDCGDVCECPKWYEEPDVK